MNQIGLTHGHKGRSIGRVAFFLKVSQYILSTRKTLLRARRRSHEIRLRWAARETCAATTSEKVFVGCGQEAYDTFMREAIETATIAE